MSDFAKQAGVGDYAIARLDSGRLALVKLESTRYGRHGRYRVLGVPVPRAVRACGFNARNLETGRMVQIKSRKRLLREPTADELRLRRYLPATGDGNDRPMLFRS